LEALSYRVFAIIEARIGRSVRYGVV